MVEALKMTTAQWPRAAMNVNTRAYRFPVPIDVALVNPPIPRYNGLKFCCLLTLAIPVAVGMGCRPTSGQDGI
jgi:hypothetical protein